MVALSFAIAVALSACGGSTPPPANKPTPVTPEVSDVERYMPLVTDTVLAYDTKNVNSGERGILMMQVRRVRSELAELSVGGRITRLEIVPQGLRVATGGWLLKSPLTQGAKFKGQFGEVTVTAVHKPLTTPAGSFSDCVETVEQSLTSEKKVTTVFCRDVGIAQLDVEGAIGDDFVRESAVLKSHGPKVDIGADLPPPPPKKP